MVESDEAPKTSAAANDNWCDLALREARRGSPLTLYFPPRMTSPAADLPSDSLEYLPFLQLSRVDTALHLEDALQIDIINGKSHNAIGLNAHSSLLRPPARTATKPSAGAPAADAYRSAPPAGFRYRALQPPTSCRTAMAERSRQLRQQTDRGLAPSACFICLSCARRLRPAGRSRAHTLMLAQLLYRWAPSPALPPVGAGRELAAWPVPNCQRFQQQAQPGAR